MKFKKLLFSSLLPLSLAATGCSDSDDHDEPHDHEAVAPTTYEFESRFDEGASSVGYSGQTLRHLLISDLISFIDGLNEEIESNAAFDASTVEPSLLSYYEFDSDTLGQNAILLSTEPATLQSTYNDISAESGKDLAGKVAGQDDGGAKDHKDWSAEFKGWNDASMAASGGDISNPDGLIRAMFATLANNAQLQVDGDPSRDGLTVTQTASGQDLKQLIQKLLLGAITFSQGADDYLDEGLSADNTMVVEGEAYSELEHAWDEGFGYFGASRSYLAQTDADIADGILLDADEDGSIDLKSEYNWGASVNASKRDAGSTSGTDYSKEAMDAFLTGRFLISQEADAEDIAAQASIAVLAWEKSLASTIVHYVNETLVDHAALGTADYLFSDHAKHWSELKGFALGLQFNPGSPLSDEDFETLHALIGDGPALEGSSEEEISEYEANLLAARALLADAYGFSDEDVENW